MSNWTLSPNLQRRHDIIVFAFPGIVIGEIGDQAHKSRHSDHNPDSRNVVHAIDVMTKSYEVLHELPPDSVGEAIVLWLEADHPDIEYFIHDGRIYETTHAGLTDEPYNNAADEHFDHVHISSLHGGVGLDAATGTGYSTTAEAYRPVGSPLDYEVEVVSDADVKRIADAVFAKVIDQPGVKSTVGNLLAVTYLNTASTKIAVAELGATAGGAK